MFLVVHMGKLEGCVERQKNTTLKLNHHNEGLRKGCNLRLVLVVLAKLRNG